METFTLVFWITMGWRLEERHLPLLAPVQCTAFRDEMLRERSPVRAECVPEPPQQSRIIDHLPVCAHGGCGWDLPGRRRV
jgi:hypothetical protein